MRDIVTLLCAVAFVAAAGIWIGATQGAPVARAPQQREQRVARTGLAATAPAPFDETGVIVLDSAPGKSDAAYLIYTDTASGKARASAKQLMFAGPYACERGDYPCSFQAPAPLVADGQQVRVTGVVVDDKVAVERVAGA